MELLSLSNCLYRHYRLTRAYYSGFSLVIQTSFENLSATDHLLYQASFLLWEYGWNVEDLPFMSDGNLQLEPDPKRAWAEMHLRSDPIDIIQASRKQLLRVPGIGPMGANAILCATVVISPNSPTCVNSKFTLLSALPLISYLTVIDKS